MKKISYSLLALSLSCFGIPVYIHLANFYFNQFQIPLALIAVVIFLCRFCDAVFDPLIGYLSDFLIKRKISRKSLIILSSLPLLISFYLIFNPTHIDKKYLLLYLGINLVLLYFFMSCISINYEALVAEMNVDKTEFIASREFMQIIGILLISVLPSLTANYLKISYDQSLSYSWIYIAPIFIISLFLLKKNVASENYLIEKPLKFFPKNREFWQLALIYILNSIAVSIPAVTIRFYIDEHLKVPHLNGHFLASYFLSAAFSVFIWNKIIKKIQVKKSWILSILFSVLIFIFAYFISAQNYQLFYLVCFLSGFAVGCDLIAPQTILIEVIKEDKNKTVYFAIFGFITRFSLALATLIGLLAIGDGDVLNYSAIPLIYALLPCVLKVIVIFLLGRFRYD